MNDRQWTDARLSDKFEVLVDELRTLRDLPQAVAKLAVEMQNVKETSANCAENQADLRQTFEDYVKEQHEAQEMQRLERKSDRRWMVTAIFTAAGLVIAAMGILVGQL